MSAQPNSLLPSALLVLNTLLAVANWYLHPERARAWAVAVLLLGGMMLTLLLMGRRSPRQPEAEAVRPGKDGQGDTIREAIVFASVILLVSLTGKLAIALGGPNVADLTWRATMAIVGGFLVFTGNAIPKTLIPLAALQCDASRAQAFQRLVGWTWVLTGLALALSWLVLPVTLAESVTFFLFPGAILISGVNFAWLRGTCQRTA